MNLKTKDDLIFNGFLSLLDNLKRDGLTDDFWMLLSILFGDNLIKVTKELFDMVKADKYISDLRNNILWRIKSSSRSTFYFIFFNGIDDFFCNCFQFRERCIKDGKCLLCKHILYVFICRALDEREEGSTFVETHSVSEKEFTELLEDSCRDTEQ